MLPFTATCDETSRLPRRKTPRNRYCPTSSLAENNTRKLPRSRIGIVDARHARRRVTNERVRAK